MIVLSISAAKLHRPITRTKRLVSRATHACSRFVFTMLATPDYAGVNPSGKAVSGRLPASVAAVRDPPGPGRRFYAETMGRPSRAPGIYRRLSVIGAALKPRFGAGPRRARRRFICVDSLFRAQHDRVILKLLVCITTIVDFTLTGSPRRESAERNLRYAQVDVFNDRPLAGNQLAVFLDPKDLPADEMIAITRDMGSQSRLSYSHQRSRGPISVSAFSA